MLDTSIIPKKLVIVNKKLRKNVKKLLTNYVTSYIIITEITKNRKNERKR